MKTFTRKDFLLSGIGLASLPFLSLGKVEMPAKLSFSTLGCPDWSFDKIIDFAKDNNYKGIEVRGILREMDLTKVPEFSTPDAISITFGNQGKIKKNGCTRVSLPGATFVIQHKKACLRVRSDVPVVLRDRGRFYDNIT